MKLSDDDITAFLAILEIEKSVINIDLESLNLIVEKVSERIPWQNLSMIESGFGEIPSYEDVKKNMLSGSGGICLDQNRFMFFFLTAIGFEVRYLLCSREAKAPSHLALLVTINSLSFFVDFGDAQPYFCGLPIIGNSVLKRGFISYKITQVGSLFKISQKKNSKWCVLYLFDLKYPDKLSLREVLNKHYTDIYQGPFWKTIHFACYPSKKLRAIKGNSILLQQDNSRVKKFTFEDVKKINENLDLKFGNYKLIGKDLCRLSNKLKNINLTQRFGLELSDSEVSSFLKSIGVDLEPVSLSFASKIIKSFINTIPFQNYKMIERGFGCIPTSRHIKEDMLSLNGGTCATMNIFLAAILYKLGFDTSLVHGSMLNENDHIGILWQFKNEQFIIDCGDGQPYFEVFKTNENYSVIHPFRTYRITNFLNKTRVCFLINEEWSHDVTYNLTPKSYQQIKITMENHYTQSDFGPFWKGLRFVIYPKEQIKAIRDNIFISQQGTLILRKKIRNLRDLEEICSNNFSKHKSQIIQCFKTLNLHVK